MIFSKHAIGASCAAILLTAPLWSQIGHAPMRLSASTGSRPLSRARVPRGFFAGTPFWADDYPYESSPSVIVVQTPPAAPAERATAIQEEPKSAAPLLIEWQGDRYIRRTSADSVSSRTAQLDYFADTKARAGKGTADIHQSQRSELPPTTFIFRDGHQEESSDYSIISGVIYARGDYWTTGSWSRQIKLSQLDLPATFKVNQGKGVSFRVPAAANEVVTRP